jgi:hypothetical protein
MSQDGEPATDEQLVLYMDEAGNTGENLLDALQPVYALSAVQIDEDSASRAVAAALSRTQMPELKFNKLQGSGSGRRNILTMLGDLDLKPGAGRRRRRAQAVDARGQARRRTRRGADAQSRRADGVVRERRREDHG